MIQRDKNHPSVVVWSLGNEAGNGNVFKSMHEINHGRSNSVLDKKDNNSNNKLGGNIIFHHGKRGRILNALSKTGPYFGSTTRLSVDLKIN